MTTAAQKKPAPPAHLTTAQKKIWRRVTTAIVDQRMVTLKDTDLDLLETLTRAIDRARTADAYLQANGYTYALVNGAVAKFPQVEILRTAEQVVMELSKRFGLTPKDRAAVEKSSGADSGFEL